MTARAREIGPRAPIALVLLVVAVTCVGTADAAVSARLDRGQVYEGDVFALIIESTGQQGGNPDLSPLERDFEILGTGTSNQFSMVNGRTSSRSTWTVRLRARRLGKLEIPPLSVGGDRTAALNVEIVEVPETVASPKDANAFIEVEIDPEGPVYVQQQIAYRVRVYQDDRVIGGELSAPSIDGAVVEQLGADRRYTSTRNGRRYRVTERLFAIAPEKSGELRIPPVAFRGQLAPPQSQPGQGGVRDPFSSPFFRNTPLAQDPFFGSAQPLRVSSKAISLDVQPPPVAAGRYWLPAATVTLQDSWATHPPELRSGEPVTRTITIQARGLNGAQLPTLEPEAPARTRLYPGTAANDTRSDGNAVYGISRQTFTYIPGQAGRLSVPALELTWWNTKTDRPETVRLARRELDVLTGSSGGLAAAPPGIPRDTVDATAAADPPPLAASGAFPWSWLIAGIVGAAVLAVLMVRRRRPRDRADTVRSGPAGSLRPQAKAPDGSDLRQRLAVLEAACGRSDPGAAAHSLLALGRLRWPDTPPASLGDLAQRLGGDREAEIMALDRALYAPGGAAWRGESLWQQVETLSWRPEQPGGRNADAGALPPLYPQNV